MIDVEVARHSAAGVQPKLVPNHDSIFIAGVVERLVRSHSHPIADNIKILLTVKMDHCVVVFRVAAKKILRHAPAPAFRENGDAVNVKVKRFVVGVVGVLPNAKSDRFLV